MAQLGYIPVRYIISVHRSTLKYSSDESAKLDDNAFGTVSIGRSRNLYIFSAFQILHLHLQVASVMEAALSSEKDNYTITWWISNIHTLIRPEARPISKCGLAKFCNSFSLGCKLDFAHESTGFGPGRRVSKPIFFGFYNSREPQYNASAFDSDRGTCH